jgi:hypothetical protein
MHQYKTAAQILLILSIFNLVLAAPVVRDIRDAHDDEVVPVIMRNVAVMSKERGESGSDGSTPSDSSPPPPPPRPDGSTPLHSSPPLPDGPMPSHSSPPLPDGSTVLDVSSPSDGEAPLHGRPTPPGGPASLAVSSPPGRTAALPVVPAIDRHGMLAAVFPSREALSQRLESLMDKAFIGGAVFLLAGGSVLYSLLHKRTIDPEWYVSNPLPPLLQTPKRPESQTPDL